VSSATKAGVITDTFDDFHAQQGMLEACEDHATKELIAEQPAVALAVAYDAGRS
jgi:hypothetical protein